MAPKIFLLLSALSLALAARPYRDPAGFRVDLPEGWRAMQSKAGHFIIVSPDPQRYVFLQPILNRTADCATTLQRTLSAGGQFRGAEMPRIQRTGPRLAVAGFVFQNGQVRGQMMCAETGRSSGMFYGVAAPVATFQRDVRGLVAVLKSFAFEAAAAPASGAGTPAGPLPAMTAWREPHELAYTMAVPQGWQVSGGIQRQDVTHYTDGVQTSSPDGSVVRLNDPRLKNCTVPGAGMAGFPQAGQYVTLCQPERSSQFGPRYVMQLLARDLGLAISPQQIRLQERPDLAQQADALPRSFGLGVQSTVSEIRFSGTRNGAPVEGMVLATVTFTQAAQGQNFLLGEQQFAIRGFVGRPEQFGTLARLTGAMAASVRINPQWWSQTQRISRQIADATLATLRQTAENQQRAFWDRMDALDRRRDAVNDILGGTVRLRDGEGNQYNAKAGSNYYFRDDDAARRAGRPDDAVHGQDLWPSPLVDLTPLEVIQ